MIETFKNDLPFSAKGFGLRRNLYCAGRTCAHVAEHGGLTLVGYQGAQPINRYRILEAKENEVFSKLARVQVLIDGTPWRLTFNNTVHYPFGYVSECSLDGVKLRHELVIDNNVLFQRVKVLKNPKGKKVMARLAHSAHCWVPGVGGREGMSWRPDVASGTLNAEIFDAAEPKPVSTRIRMGVAGGGAFSLLETQSFKFYINTLKPADEHLFYMAFNQAPDEDLSSARVDAKLAAFEKKMRSVVRFDTGDKVLDSALVNANAVVADLEIEIPGAFRASPFYWVWAWDSMVHSEAMLLGGWSEAVKRMLLFFKKYDLAMAYPADCKVERSLILGAQLFYVTMLYSYYAATGDKETLDECLPFAKDVVDKAVAKIGEDGSLSLGRGIFPDSPQCLGQSETDDYSVINNSIYYQGLRAWAELSGEREELARKVGEGFSRLFWDDKEGYWCDSVVGKTLERREYYPCYGQLYCSPFALDLRAEELPRIVSFMKRNFLSEHGIRMLPLDRPGFMADGIQLGEFFPVSDRYYWNAMNAAGDASSIEDFERIVVSYWKTCTYPEGQTNEIVNTDPLEYEDCPGLKQAFTAKPWFCDALELNLGLRLKLDGIHLNPLKGKKPFKMRKLVLRGKKIDIERKTGSGAKPLVKLNGRIVEGSFIPWSALSAKNRIVVEWTR